MKKLSLFVILTSGLYFTYNLFQRGGKVQPLPYRNDQREELNTNMDKVLAVIKSSENGEDKKRDHLKRVSDIKIKLSKLNLKKTKMP